MMLGAPRSFLSGAEASDYSTQVSRTFKRNSGLSRSVGLGPALILTRQAKSGITEYFNTKPFNLKHDASKNLISMLEDLVEQAVKRQQQSPGRTYVGAILQHLVGAKLELALPDTKIEHHGHSVADKTTRSGDFDLGEVVIHCTTAPQESLLLKCRANIQSGKRPIILTKGKMIGSAEELARSIGIAERVEILDILQFVTMNLYELSLSKSVQRQVTVASLVEKYNKIVENCEADPSFANQVRVNAVCASHPLLGMQNWHPVQPPEVRHNRLI